MGKNIEKSPLKQPKTTISKVKKRNPYKKSPIYYIMDKICCEIVISYKMLKF